MTTFYLFRHGLATKSTTGYGAHVVSATLLPKGIAAIKRLGNYLKDKPVDLFASSEFPRCAQTAEIVQSITQKKFHTDPRLNEYHDISFEDFLEKVKDMVDFIEQAKFEHVWLCTHVAVIIAMKRLLLREPIVEKDLSSNLPATGALTIIHGTSVEELDFNNAE